MNSYGDPSSARGRDQFPDARGDHGAADDPYQRPSWDDQAASRRSAHDGERGGWSASAGQPDDPTTRPGAGGRASSGRATPPGRAGVGRAAPVSPAAGSASVGSAPPGRARVGGRAGVGSASVPDTPGSGGGYGTPGSDGGYGTPGSGAGYGAGRAGGRASTGRASVGAASVSGAGAGGAAGRATVGRAVVPVSPAGPGGPGGPDGPTGPGRRGRRGGGDGDPAAVRRAKKRKRMNMIIAAFAVFIILTGGGVVTATWYSTKMVMPDELPLPVATTVYAYNNKDVIAKLGDQNRQIVTIKQIPLEVQHAVVSAEDRKFYDHDGVDYVGIARAAWNNFTGGSKQGASTITQQYARNAYAELKDDSYQRKIKEAVLASKLNDQLSKEEILQHYLNIVYFGRGAYGIEIAAQTYFGKPAKDLKVAEGAVLAALIKQPEPDKFTGHKGYDPADNPDEAKGRWDYVLQGMVEKNWLSAEERAKLEYPKVKPRKNANESFGVATPRGNVINYVKAEMAQKGICTMGPTEPNGKLNCSEALRDGGYKIRTTIDWKMQKAAEDAAQRKTGSEIKGQPSNLMAALVAIDPKTGRVMAYYGGDSGAGYDYAGLNTDQAGTLSGGHPPGSSFKVYTLAAAINEDISIDSHWDSTDYKVPGTEIKVRNAGRTAACGKWCTLEYSTIQSYNVPFYHVTEKIGADKVLKIARDAGINTMWETKDIPPKWHDLTKKDPKDLTPEPFFNVLAYGQYPVTVLDHTNGLATLANGGIYNKAHFVYSIEQQDKDTGKWKRVDGEKREPKQRIKKEVADEVTAVLKKLGAVQLGGRQAAGKTGTWEYSKTSFNAHAWMVGYTPQLASAVWVGSKDSKRPEIKDKNGRNINGSDLPASIWNRFMKEALKDTPPVALPDAKHIGNKDAGNGTEPVQPPPTNPDTPGGGPNCQGPNPSPLCPPNNPGGPGNPGGDPGGDPDNPGGGGIVLPPTNGGGGGRNRSGG